MTTMRPPYQLELALPMPGRGEAPRRDVQEVEAATATTEPESPASTEHLMEAICDPDNRSGVACSGAQQGGTRRRRHYRQTAAGHPQSALVRDRRSTAPGALPAAAGASGEDPEAGRRDAQPWHSNRDRSGDSAGGPAAAPAAVGPDIQRAQLRLPAGPLRPPSGGAGASLRR